MIGLPERHDLTQHNSDPPPPPPPPPPTTPPSPLPPLFFKGGKKNLITSPGGVEYEELKKEWKYGAGAGLLIKGGRGGWRFSYLIF